jgi:hypothetical protein
MAGWVKLHSIRERHHQDDWLLLLLERILILVSHSILLEHYSHQQGIFMNMNDYFDYSLTR